MKNSTIIPLAQRVRPNGLSEVVGQEKVLDKLKKMVLNQQLFSIIFWGNPGVGKTTIAYLLSKEIELPFRSISAIQSGVKDIRNILEETKDVGQIVLFIDEIHRFNKSQQDSLLKSVEEGTIILIGATTENHSFEVNRALLSRCEVLILEDLSIDNLKKIALNAIKSDQWLKERKTEIIEWESLLKYSAGDGRKLLNLIEIITSQSEIPVQISNNMVENAINSNVYAYDKNGEMHYDIVSAFIKSIRGSSPDAAVYYLARMIAGGEDPKFIARRMLILASEDIGLANSNALLLANACFEAVEKIGYPECRIILSQTAVYLATSPKSNSTYLAIDLALDMCRKMPDLPIPLHLRNAPTKLMKDLGYGENYLYAHSFEGNFVKQAFLPSQIEKATFYKPGNNPREKEINLYLKKLWG